MKKLSEKQLSRTSEIAGNIAVAWFSAGAISPVFSRPKSLLEFSQTFILPLFVAGFFFVISLKLEEPKT